jgi:hypothetical protein
MTKYSPISLEGVKTFPLKDRASKVSVDDFGKPWVPGGKMRDWLGSLPGILAADEIRKVADSIVKAARSGKMVILGMGAHAVKAGLSPIIIDLMEKGVIKGIAVNGAGIIHDFETAMAGKTSEDVSAGLGDGTFGVAEETGRFMNEAIIEGARQKLGLGRAIGAMLKKEHFTYNRFSILARGFDLDIPVTVHVAIGTDIIHFHPSADGAATGSTSHMDFRIFADLVSRLEDGVFINLGSAVIIPEVFLKALALVRNLGKGPGRFTTVNMDFIKGYRPMTNVVHRPTLEGGTGYSLIGHHEIMFPLLAASVIEGLQEAES